MRISDWSSDVCSSDLVFAANLPALPARGQLAVVLEPAQHELRLVGQQLAIEHRRELPAVVVVEFVGMWLDHVVGFCVVTRSQDWESVVLGKSVSVRLAPGGSSNIKYKTQ